jgi:hypothetical protein
MTMSITQVIQFHSRTKIKTFLTPMISIKYPNKIPKRSYENWSSFIQIPPLIHSSNGLCKIIDIGYKVQLDFKPSGTMITQTLDIPITIGTRPLIETSTSNELYTSDLPSYEFCIGDDPVEITNLVFDKNKNNEELFQSGQNDFRPLYPYFNNYSKDSLKK